MAKRTTTPATVNAPATTATANGKNENSKAKAIRAYKAGHPDAGPKEIAEALGKDGVEVTAGRVSAVLRSGTASSKVDVDTIKRAAEFLRTFNGKVEEAVKAIDSVGQYVVACGGAEKAKAAIEAYQAVAALVK